VADKFSLQNKEYKNMKADIFDINGKKTGSMELPRQLFGVRWSPDAVRQVVNAMSANQRQPVAHAKTRGEVAGSGIKPWRQKGTGRARHGSRRSPIWVGGGTTHGPRNDKDYSQKINRKMKRFALASLLSKKCADGEVFVFENLELKPAKTKLVATMMKNAALPKSVLFVRATGSSAFSRAARNIPKVEVFSEKNINAQVCLAHAAIAFEKSALETLAAAYVKETKSK
jgi:large subunit ribosomal protein L4